MVLRIYGHKNCNTVKDKTIQKDVSVNTFPIIKQNIVEASHCLFSHVFSIYICGFVKNSTYIIPAKYKKDIHSQYPFSNIEITSKYAKCIF